MGGVIKNYDGKLMEAGGTFDHVHLLVGLSLPDKFSDLVRDVKTNSSLWLKKNSTQQYFAWQEGYGSFSVSYSSLEKVKHYIKNQEEHHKTKNRNPTLRQPALARLRVGLATLPATAEL